MRPSRVLYLFHKSLVAPIPRLHGLAQVIALAREGRPFSVLSFEPRPEDPDDAAAYSETRSDLLRAGVSHSSLPMTGSRWVDIPLGAAWVLAAIVFRGVRIVHARSYIPAIMGLLACALTPTRLLFDARGLFVDEYVYEGAFRSGSPRYRFARWLERRLYLGANRVVVVSERFRQHILSRGDLAGRLDPGKVEVIPNRVDLARFRITEEERREYRSLHRWGEDTVGVYVGSSSPWHVLDRACEIMADVMRARPDVRFVVATYPNTRLAERMIREAVIPEGRVECMAVRTEEVPQVLCAADFAIMLEDRHLVREVCAPIKFSEYAAAGLPIVTNDGIGDVSGWVREHRLGIIVDPDDVPAAARKVMALLDSDDFESRAMAGRLARFAEREMAMEDTLRQYEDIYRALEAS